MGIGVGKRVLLNEDGCKADEGFGARGNGEGFFMSLLLSLLSRSAKVYRLPTSTLGSISSIQASRINT